LPTSTASPVALVVVDELVCSAAGFAAVGAVEKLQVGDVEAGGELSLVLAPELRAVWGDVGPVVELDPDSTLRTEEAADLIPRLVLPAVVARRSRDFAGLEEGHLTHIPL
jgi:hypothetical protein